MNGLDPEHLRHLRSAAPKMRALRSVARSAPILPTDAPTRADPLTRAYSHPRDRSRADPRADPLADNPQDHNGPPKIGIFGVAFFIVGFALAVWGWGQAAPPIPPRGGTPASTSSIHTGSNGSTVCGYARPVSVRLVSNIMPGSNQYAVLCSDGVQTLTYGR